MSLKQVTVAVVETGKKVRALVQSPQGQAAIGAVKMFLGERRLRQNPADKDARRSAHKGARQAGEGLGTLAALEILKRQNPPKS